MRYSILAFALGLAACAPPQSAPAPEAPAAEAAVAHTAPAGAYTLDKSHASLIIRVSHIGYSNFTARFVNWDASLNLDPAAPENSTVDVTIDPRSIESDNPPAGFIDIMRNDFLKSREFPQITFRSTRIERIGPNTARITGDLTLLGVSRPVTLEARFNGGYEGMALDPNARVGFSAHGTFNPSNFGISYVLPPKGSISGSATRSKSPSKPNFTGPAWTPPPP